MVPEDSGLLPPRCHQRAYRVSADGFVGAFVRMRTAEVVVLGDSE